MAILTVNKLVIVNAPKINDLWSHSFMGHVVEIKSNCVIVQDQDENCFNVDFDQISHTD